MNKSDLIDRICAACGEMSMADAGRALDAVTTTITNEVAAGGTVTLVGFGTFKSALREAREGRNPSNGETIQIAASTVPKFVAGSAFKEAVNAAAKAAKTAKGKAKK